MIRPGPKEPQKRRGVQMTASARLPRGEKGRPAWQEELEKDGGEEATVAQDSNLEWEALEREVKAELAVGTRDDIVDYDDVTSDPKLLPESSAGGPPRSAEDRSHAENQPKGPPQSQKLTERLQALADVVAAEKRMEEALRPESVVTAGQAAQDKKRGGQKRTGASRREKKDGDVEEVEDAQAEPGRKVLKTGEDQKGKGKGKGKGKDKPYDPDRWVKLKLQGEEKAKNIDATRVVHYFDFDTRISEETVIPIRDHETAAQAGNFRSSVRMNLYDDDDDEDEDCRPVQGPQNKS